MEEIASKNLRDYLRRIRDLEVSCYKQQLHIDNLSEELGRGFQPELEPQAWHVTEESIGEEKQSYFNNCVLGLVIGVFIGFTVGVLALYGDFLAFIVIFGGVAGLIVAIYLTKKKKESIKNKITKMNQEIDENNLQIEARNEVIEAQAWQERLQKVDELNRAKETLANTEEIRDAFYKQNVLYSKYRSLVPVTMLCEYVESGRCNSLTGYEGAYRLYEEELIANTISNRLDVILSSLDSIKNNQYMLSVLLENCLEEIRRLEETSKRHGELLGQIRDNTERSEYYNKITAQNTEFLKWLEFFKRNEKK